MPAQMPLELLGPPQVRAECLSTLASRASLLAARPGSQGSLYVQGVDGLWAAFNRRAQRTILLPPRPPQSPSGRHSVCRSRPVGYLLHRCPSHTSVVAFPPCRSLILPTPAPGNHLSDNCLDLSPGLMLCFWRSTPRQQLKWLQGSGG